MKFTDQFYLAAAFTAPREISVSRILMVSSQHFSDRSEEFYGCVADFFFVSVQRICHRISFTV